MLNAAGVGSGVTCSVGPQLVILGGVGECYLPSEILRRCKRPERGECHFILRRVGFGKGPNELCKQPETSRVMGAHGRTKQGQGHIQTLLGTRAISHVTRHYLTLFPHR